MHELDKSLGKFNTEKIKGILFNDRQMMFLLNGCDILQEQLFQ
jgi:hypothetical protein